MAFAESMDRWAGRFVCLSARGTTVAMAGIACRHFVARTRSEGTRLEFSTCCDSCQRGHTNEQWCTRLSTIYGGREPQEDIAECSEHEQARSQTKIIQRFCLSCGFALARRGYGE